MELINGSFLFILIPAIILILLLKYKKKSKYGQGLKIANTKITKKIPRFNKLLKKYKIYKILLISCYATLFLFLSLLLARPVKIKSDTTVISNRDIVLCMDISGSVLDLNKEIVSSMRDTVKRLKNDRFAISIFNTTSVLLMPLTDDYEYTLEMLDKIEKGIEIMAKNPNPNIIEIDNFTNEEEELFFMIRDGTLYDNVIHGSSLIGEGLASCVYSFSNLEDERSRTIIFSTDNDVQNIGEVFVPLQQAASISKSKNIIVYGIATTNTTDEDYSDLASAVKITGGETFKSLSGSAVRSIVDNIEKQLTTDTKITEVKKIDIPQVPFYIIVSMIIILTYLDKKVKV